MCYEAFILGLRRVSNPENLEMFPCILNVGNFCFRSIDRLSARPNLVILGFSGLNHPGGR